MPDAIIDGTGLTGSAMKVNEDGSLNVREQGFSSTANTSTTLPLSGGSIVGAWEQNAYPDVFNVVKTDVTGSIFLDFSVDGGSNIDFTANFRYDPSKANPPHIFVKADRCFRARFLNTSGVAATEFRMNTYYGTYNKLTNPINGLVAQNYDATVSQSRSLKV